MVVKTATNSCPPLTHIYSCFIQCKELTNFPSNHQSATFLRPYSYYSETQCRPQEKSAKSCTERWKQARLRDEERGEERRVSRDDDWGKKRWGRDRKGEGVRETEEGQEKRVRCVYPDEICRPQQTPVKRNRISSPLGESLQECRWRIVAYRFLLDIWATHTLTDTPSSDKKSDFHSLNFSPKGIFPFPFIHKNMIVCDWNTVGKCILIPIHFVLLTSCFCRYHLSFIIFKSADFNLIHLGEKQLWFKW